MTEGSALVPVDIVTGFLGSGKTTLLARLLKSPDLRDTAVLVNEFGEVGLDHHLIEHAQESVLLLENGCLCCAIRGDLQDALRTLFSQRERGEIPHFRRVAVETSGLADPTPIAYTILTEPVLRHHFRLGRIVTAVDALNAEAQLARHPESVRQAAIADRLVLTKTALVEDGGRAARAAVAAINGAAPVVDADAGPLAPEMLLTADPDAGPDADMDDAWSGWRGAAFGPEGPAAGGSGHADHSHGDHSHGVASFCLRFGGPMDWTAFGLWMTMLLNRHGERVLRIKGMLNVAGVADPVLINGVQHVVHPPGHLTGWPDDDRSSRIVFIVQGIDRAAIEGSLNAFNALAAA